MEGKCTMFTGQRIEQCPMDIILSRRVRTDAYHVSAVGFHSESRWFHEIREYI